MFQHQLLPRQELECQTIDNRHFYSTPTGLYPSVTTVIDNLKDKTFLTKWRERIGDSAADKIVQESRKHGNAIHQICEEYLLNKKVWKLSSTNDLASFFKISPLLDKNIEIVYGVELKVWSPTLKTAGTTDAVVKWQGENTILDLKTSRKPVEQRSEKIRLYMLQAVAYSLLVEEQYAMEVPWCCILVLVKDEPEPTVIRFLNEPYKEVAKSIFLKA
jgi:hypothetical protein